MAIKRINVANRSFNADDDHFPIWWDNVCANIWEPATFKTFEKYGKPNSLVVDIGAWVGGTVLYAAAGGCDVVTYEPDPVAHRILLKNLAMNPKLASHIQVHNVAVGAQAGKLELFNNVPGNSGSSLVNHFGYLEQSKQKVCALVDVVDGFETLAELDMDRVSLVKIDIEGAEYDLIPRIAPILEQYRPALHLSLHPLNISGEDDDDRISKQREKTVRIAEALKFYNFARCESGDFSQIVDPVEPFHTQAERAPFPRAGWVFADD